MTARRIGLIAIACCLAAPAWAQESLTLAWGVGWQRVAGAGWKHEAAVLAVVATQPVADGLTAQANIGWARAPTIRLPATPWALALAWNATDGLDLVGQTYGDDRSPPWLALGARQVLGEHSTIDAAWAMRDDPVRSTRWTVGLHVGF